MEYSKEMEDFKEELSIISEMLTDELDDAHRDWDWLNGISVDPDFEEFIEESNKTNLEKFLSKNDYDPITQTYLTDIKDKNGQRIRVPLEISATEDNYLLLDRNGRPIKIVMNRGVVKSKNWHAYAKLKHEEGHYDDMTHPGKYLKTYKDARDFVDQKGIEMHGDPSDPLRSEKELTADTYSAKIVGKRTFNMSWDRTIHEFEENNKSIESTMTRLQQLIKLYANLKPEQEIEQRNALRKRGDKKRKQPNIRNILKQLEQIIRDYTLKLSRLNSNLEVIRKKAGEKEPVALRTASGDIVTVDLSDMKEAKAIYEEIKQSIEAIDKDRIDVYHMTGPEFEAYKTPMIKRLQKFYDKQIKELKLRKEFVNRQFSESYIIEEGANMAGTSLSESVNVAMNRILEIDPHDINMTFLQTMFAAHHNRENNTFQEANFKPTTKILLTPKQYQYVKKPTETTIGRLILNRYLLEMNGILEFLDYYNNPIDSKGLDNLNTEVNNLVLEDKITTDRLVDYIDARDRLGFWVAGFLTVSITPALLLPMDNVKKRKAELFKEHQAELESDNPVTQIMANNAIEKELMAIVRENLKADSGYDFYRSGDGNLDNNYKTINVMRGAVFDQATKKYHITESSLMEGIKPRDITPFANSVIAAAYPSAVGTAEAGYMSKQLIALLQSEHIDPDPNSDCGTQSTIPVRVTKSNKQYLAFRNIKEGGKVKQTTLHNIGDYVGQTINLYSPQCCRNKTICAKCAGRLFYDMAGGEVVNIGMLMSVITQKILNLKLKSKHDLSQKAGFMNAEDTFLNPTNAVEVTEDGYLRAKQHMKIHVPKTTDEISAYYIESTFMHCLGVAPVRFYDAHGGEQGTNLMTVPTMVDLLIYGDLQEDENYYILSYEPGANIVSLGFQQNVQNVCEYFELIYLHSRIPIIPYHLMTDMMFRNLELNKIDLDGPSLVYELLARRLCRYGRDTFAFVYGADPKINKMAYEKLPYREAVQQAGTLQAIVFEDISKGINVNLASAINGHEPEETPLDAIIRA